MCIGTTGLGATVEMICATFTFVTWKNPLKGHPPTTGLVPLDWPLKVAYSKVPLFLLSDASFLR